MDVAVIWQQRGLSFFIWKRTGIAVLGENVSVNRRRLRRERALGAAPSCAGPWGIGEARLSHPFSGKEFSW